MNLGTATILRANARAIPLPDDSVDLIVTSPPYFALRSYQDGGEHYAGQIGDEPTPAEFVDSLLEVTRECMRVLKPSGSLWVNLGDKYSTYESRPGKAATHEWAEKSQDSTRYTRSAPEAYGIKYKSLFGIPWRYALRCIDDLGLILRAELIWSKPNGLPESVTDRVRRSHEQWFHFTREPRYFSAVDEIREPHTREWGGKPNGGGYYRDELTRGEKDANLPDALPNPLGKLPGSVWTVPTEPLRVPGDLGVDHFAAFPTEWPKRIIQGWSPAGVCVACGEGRRPVVDVEHETLRDQNTTGRPKQQDLSGDRNNGWNKVGYPKTRALAAITGYVCACNEPIATPTGRAGASDPSLETGRAGFNRPRGDAAGVRIVTRWEQRHEAEQLRTSEHREEMAKEAGTRFKHYVRTDRAGARPIPEHLRADWRARGWLTPAPDYTPAPTQPAIVLDPFGGTGTTAMVAKALGRHGISVDMSADYCRLAGWRTNDRDQLAKVLGIAKASGPTQDESLFDLLDGESA